MIAWVGKVDRGPRRHSIVKAPFPKTVVTLWRVVDQDGPAYLGVLLTVIALQGHVCPSPAMIQKNEALRLRQIIQVWRKWLPKVMSLGAIRSTPRTAFLACMTVFAASIGVWL